MKANYTPMIEQYRKVKAAHQEEILFFRLGDFYEMFFDDALLASRELEITLTGRGGGLDKKVPMCGVPYHAAQNYIAKLIDKGYKVAICEQMEDPKLAKGIVEREVIKIITPATFLADDAVDKGNNFLAAVGEAPESLIFTASDVSTGECSWTIFAGDNRFSALCDQLFRLAPSELLFVGELSVAGELQKFIRERLGQCLVTVVPTVRPEEQRLLAQHFKTGIPDSDEQRQVIAALLAYLHKTVKQDLSQINQLVYYNGSKHLSIDAATLRNLEITRNMRDGTKRGTLLSVLDFTATAMGSRLLRSWLEYPLLHPVKINDRQDAVEEMVKTVKARDKLGEALKEIYDFERIMTKVEIGSANARDLTALKTSFLALPALKQAVADCTSRVIACAAADLSEHSTLAAGIGAAIVDDPPFSLREGGIIRPGYDSELDELRAISTNSKQWVAELEAKERERTGIKSLKIGYNRVFGYYIEITKSNVAAAPANYVRKQTLVNAERYITPELKDFETKILGAQEKIVNIEYRLFIELKDRVKEELTAIQDTAKRIALLDALRSLAEAADRYGYIRPHINASKGEIIIKDGRHPVVERLLDKELFVPNDVKLNDTDHELLIITGPNMAGKSTYMRQTALLVLMAQAGSFIPAREAEIAPVDKIFTRVGASDDLATGQSTFMVEMNEVAHILQNATPDSLIILDEIGRGTSTYDGISIARAVVEYLLQHIHAKTLFATHYHELIDMADEYEHIKNYSIAVRERGRDVVFLRRIVPGGADKSYGIHVAQLAGLPKQIIRRAEKLLIELEKKAPLDITAAASDAAHPDKDKAAADNGASLFAGGVVNELVATDITAITPIEAMNVLYRLQQQAKREMGV